MVRLGAAERGIHTHFVAAAVSSIWRMRRAAFAHRLNEVTHAARAVGVLVAVPRLVARRLLELHLGPVRFHLVGNHHRQARADAGAHLGASRDDGHVAVLVDGDINVRIVGHTVTVRHSRPAGGIRLKRLARARRREAHGKHEARREKRAGSEHDGGSH